MGSGGHWAGCFSGHRALLQLLRTPLAARRFDGETLASYIFWPGCSEAIAPESMEPPIFLAPRSPSVTDAGGREAGGVGTSSRGLLLRSSRSKLKRLDR